ncbi:MAG: RNA polymerase sigma factor [Nanoarchaeota archaeon]|nr:RNA polymerase sigma factor [Nanoarchaeota archaeon]
MSHLLSLREEIKKNNSSLLDIAMVITSGREEDARDLRQDGVERMLTYEHRYKPGTKMLNWAFIIMRNLFFNKCAMKRKEQNLLQPVENIDELPGKKLTPRAIDMNRILECMQELPDNQKVALELSYDGYSGKDISEILNIPWGSVRSRIYYARKKLMNKLEEEK